MTHGTAPDVVLADLIDANCGHHARVQTEAFQSILHGKRVHHRGEHPHVIAGHAVHSGACEPGAAKDVAAADDDRHLHTHLGYIVDLACDALQDERVDA